MACVISGQKLQEPGFGLYIFIYTLFFLYCETSNVPDRGCSISLGHDIKRTRGRASADP